MLGHLGLCGLGSSVGIATGYGMDGQGIGSRWVETSRTCPDRPWGPPSLLYNERLVFPGGKERQGRDAYPLPPSGEVIRKDNSHTATPLSAVRHVQGLSACTRVFCVFFSLRYTACNSHEPYCHIWPARIYNIFPLYLTKERFSTRSYRK
jgi:hypothetical protein